MKYIGFLDDLLKDMNEDESEQSQDSRNDISDPKLKEERHDIEQLSCEGQTNFSLPLMEELDANKIDCSAESLFDSP